MMGTFEDLKKKREEIILSLKEFFKENAGRFSIEMVFLYGSWARGFPRDNSDIDIALVFSEKLNNTEESFKQILDISILLEGKIGMEVNILQIQRDFDKPMLYYSAIIQGIPIYINNFEHYFDLRNEAIFQMEDFSIFGIDWQLKVAKRNLESIKNA